MSYPYLVSIDTISYDLPYKFNRLSGIYCWALVRVAKTSSFTVWAGDTDTVKEQYYACSNTITATLPAANSTDAGEGRLVQIKNIGSGTVTVDGDSSDTIDGAATLNLAPNQAVTIISDGTSNWEII